MTGGSDHHLGARLRRSGATVSLAPQAFADEIVRPERISVRSAVVRLLRNGNVMARVDQAIATEQGESVARARANGTVFGAGRVVVGLGRAVLGSLSGQLGIAGGLKTSIIGVGQVAGSFGHTITEYQRTTQARVPSTTGGAELDQTSAYPKKVAIGIASFKRPYSLAALLKSLTDLVPVSADWEFVGIVVVDNDRDRSAEAAATSADLANLVYVCEPKPGITAARNRAVAEALNLGATSIAFIDDDQTVTPDWLRELTSAESMQPSSAIIGAVRYRHPPQTPQWFRGLQIFEDQLVDGSEDDNYFTTNNLLLQIQPWPVAPPLFDERFGTSGGEDHHLGARLERAGQVISFAPRALAYESVLPERVDARTAVRRLLRNGNVLARTDRAIAEENGESILAVQSKSLLMGTARIPLGLGRAIFRSTGGVRGMMSGVRTSVIGVGQIWGVVGNTVEEYHQ